VSNIQLSCLTTDTFHLCTQASDCAADTANPNCCTVGAYQVCINDTLKTLGRLTCL
jgi:hypothetical protein